MRINACDPRVDEVMLTKYWQGAKKENQNA